MIDFARSHFTWDHRPHRPDPDYKYPGGFVGEPGDAYHVRIGYDAVCTIGGDDDAPPLEIFLLQPCLAEYTIADRNLFQVPSQEFRVALSRTHGIPIARRPSTEREPTAATPHAGRFAGTDFTTHEVPDARVTRDTVEVTRAVLAGRRLNARTTHHENALGLTVTLEYPIRTINIERAKGAFQVDTGPMALPDLATWDGATVSRVFPGPRGLQRLGPRRVHPAPRGRAVGIRALVVGGPGPRPPRAARPVPNAYRATAAAPTADALQRDVGRDRPQRNPDRAFQLGGGRMPPVYDGPVAQAACSLGSRPATHAWSDPTVAPSRRQGISDARPPTRGESRTVADISQH